MLEVSVAIPAQKRSSLIAICFSPTLGASQKQAPARLEALLCTPKHRLSATLDAETRQRAERRLVYVSERDNASEMDPALEWPARQSSRRNLLLSKSNFPDIKFWLRSNRRFDAWRGSSWIPRADLASKTEPSATVLRRLILGMHASFHS